MKVIFHAVFLCLLAVSLSVPMAACSKRPNEIQPTYIAPYFYEDYSCDRLAEEHARLTRKIETLYKKQNMMANKDVAAVGASVLLFNPAIFFMIGKDEQEEIAFIKGEYNAVDDVAIAKDCPVAHVIAAERAAAAEQEQKRLFRNPMKEENLPQAAPEPLTPFNE